MAVGTIFDIAAGWTGDSAAIDTFVADECLKDAEHKGTLIRFIKRCLIIAHTDAEERENLCRLRKFVETAPVGMCLSTVSVDDDGRVTCFPNPSL